MSLVKIIRNRSGLAHGGRSDHYFYMFSDDMYRRGAPSLVGDRPAIISWFHCTFLLSYAA